VSESVLRGCSRRYLRLGGLTGGAPLAETLRPAAAQAPPSAQERGPSDRLPNVDGEVVAESKPISQSAHRRRHQKPPKHKPPPPAKPPNRAKPPRSAKPLKDSKLARLTKPVVAAKPAGTGTRPKPARPAKPKPATPRAPSTQRDPRGRRRITSPSTERRTVTRGSLSAVADTPVERKLTCSIFGSRNGQIADYYALASGPSGREWIVGRSPWFEWLAGDTPAEAYEAHAILVDELLQNGWRSAGFEGAWYRQRFELTLRASGD
jgi:hypothetical protein